MSDGVHFVLMSGEDISAEYTSDRTGTILAVFDDEGAATAALDKALAASHVQRRMYDEWARLSYSENPILPHPGVKDPFMANIRGIGDRNVRRAEWIKLNPIPPTDMLHQIWLVRVPSEADGPKAPEGPQKEELKP